MICTKCDYIGVGRTCPRCGAPMVPEAQQEEEMFQRVAEGLANSVKETGEETWAGKPLSAEDREEEREYYYEDRERAPRYEEEEFEDDYDDYEPEEESLGEEIRRGAARAAAWGMDAVDSAGTVMSRSLQTVWDMLCTVLRIGSACIMAVLAIYMTWTFLAELGSFHVVMEILHGESRTLTLYAGIAGVLVAFAVLQIFWILKKSRRKIDGVVRRIDRGHGLMAFLIYLVIVIFATAAAGFLPEGEGVMAVAYKLCSAFQTMGNPYLMLSGLGVVLCLIRRVCGSL